MAGAIIELFLSETFRPLAPLARWQPFGTRQAPSRCPRCVKTPSRARCSPSHTHAQRQPPVHHHLTSHYINMNATKPATRANSSRPRREGAGRRSRPYSPDKRPQLARAKQTKKPSAARAKKPDPVRASQPDPFNARTRRHQGLTGTPARGNTPARKSQASARTRKCFEPFTVTRVL